MKNYFSMNAVAAILFPCVVLGALVAMNFYKRDFGGDVWEIPIEGYDPRDLLKGHYLRFRFRFQTAENANSEEKCNGPACCLCLSKNSDGTRKYPSAIKMECEPARACDAFVLPRPVEGEKYFIPELEATRLEDLLRTGKASLTVTIGRSGEMSFRDLLIDGKDWRTANP